eukprot:jgi/Galph1/4773/GphlegSOOS_G3438.1
MSHLLLTRDRRFGRARNILRWISESLTSQLVDTGNTVCLFCVYPSFSLGPILYSLPDNIPELTVVCFSQQDALEAQKFVEEQYPNLTNCHFLHWIVEETNFQLYLDEYDVILCWGCLERLFYSLDLLKEFLSHLSRRLKPKGFCAGITLDSSYLWTSVQKHLEKHPATNPMTIEYPLWIMELPNGDFFVPLGTLVSIRYPSELRKKVVENEYLVHAPTLFRCCDTFGLEWIDWINGRDWWLHHRKIGHHRLLEMGVVTKDSSTLSKDEHDLLGIFACFITIKHGSYS